MNAYDFDKTILHGDSTQRFLRFLWKRDKRLTWVVPRVMLYAAAYYSGLIDKTRCKEHIYRCVFPRVDDIEGAVADFWEENIRHVKAFYLAQKKEDDAVISASPEFLLAPVCEKLGITRLIASRVDPKTGKYTGINCHGAEKVVRFREVFGDTVPEEFYSDSLSDTPMAKISAKAYLVKGDRIKQWP